MGLFINKVKIFDPNTGRHVECVEETVFAGVCGLVGMVCCVGLLWLLLVGLGF